MKNRTKLPNIYIGVVTAVLYLPIVLVIIYSFNESKISSVWGGFSLKWYETLFRDAAMFEALGNSIVLALCASLGAAVIGTLGAYGFTKVQLRTKSAVEYVSMLPIMIPEIILGMVFMTFFALIGLPFGMTTLILAHTAFCVPYVYMLVKARLVGMDKSLAEAALTRSHDVIILAIKSQDSPILQKTRADTVVQAGDVLLVAGSKIHLQGLNEMM